MHKAQLIFSQNRSEQKKSLISLDYEFCYSFLEAPIKSNLFGKWILRNVRCTHVTIKMILI